MNRLAIAFLTLLSFSFVANAEIYQITDEKGNKVFTNIEPKNSKGKTVQKVELKQTNTTLSDGIAEDDYLQQRQKDRQEYDEQLTKFEQQRSEARRSVSDAERNLEQARELQPGDYFNIPGKGMRYKDSYHERVKLAEEQLQQARLHLNSLQQEKPEPARTSSSQAPQ